MILLFKTTNMNGMHSFSIEGYMFFDLFETEVIQDPPFPPSSFWAGSARSEWSRPQKKNQNGHSGTGATNTDGLVRHSSMLLNAPWHAWSKTISTSLLIRQEKEKNLMFHT